MKSITELKFIIDKEFNNIKYPSNPRLLYEPIEYVMGLKGKRIRSVLVLAAHQLFDNNLKKAIAPALAIEMFHNFTLLHDDIMDQAPLRRGQMTVHKKWSNNIAILSGDTMMIKSYQFLSNINPNILKQTLHIFNQAAINVCEGQQWDLEFEIRKKVNISEYLKMIEYKTAVLLATALKIGGITSGSNVEIQNNLYDFGRNMGIAFQLKDDLLDVFGSSNSFGKQEGGDILANKKTYLYLKALEIADKKLKKDLITYYSNKDESINKVKNVKKIFIQLGIPELTEKLIREYHFKAINKLEMIKSKFKSPLIDFSEILLNRIN